MFNCIIYPRQDVDVSLLDVIHLFRCAAMPQRYLVDCHIPVKKNHYVPLCQPSVDLEPGENYFQPKSIFSQIMKLNVPPPLHLQHWQAMNQSEMVKQLALKENN